MGTIRQRATLKRGKTYTAQVRKIGFESQTQTFRVKADAVNWVRQVEASMVVGAFSTQRVAKTATMLDQLKRYELEVTPKKKSAVKELSQIRFLKGLRIFERSVSKLTAADFSQLRDEWLESGLKASSVVRRLALLSHVYTTCRTEWKMAGLPNPLLDVKKPSISDARTRVVARESTPENLYDDDDENDENIVDRPDIGSELDQVIRATESALLPDATRFAVLTAMRRSELVRLQWKDVNLRAGTAHLPETKNGNARTVPLHPEAKEILKKLRDVNDGRPEVFSIQADSLTKAFGRALSRARDAYEESCAGRGIVPDPVFLVGLRFHDLRHEATTRLASIFPLHELAKITGHKTPEMLLRYYHPKAEDLAKKFASHAAWA